MISTYSISLCIYRCMNKTDYMGGIRYHELDNANTTFSFTTTIDNFLDWSVILWLCQPNIFIMTFCWLSYSTTCRCASAVGPISLVDLDCPSNMNPSVVHWWLFKPIVFPVNLRQIRPPISIRSYWITLTSFPKKITPQHSPTCCFLCKFQETLKNHCLVWQGYKAHLTFTPSELFYTYQLV